MTRNISPAICALIWAPYMMLHAATKAQPPVRLPAEKVQEISQKIDDLVAADLQRNHIQANPRIDDATFLRRAYLTIAGRIPNLAERQAFIQMRTSDRRALLIDQLLTSPGYVSNTYNYWADLLRIMDRLPNLANQGGLDSGAQYEQWLRESLQENKPYNQMVYELLNSSGGLWERGNGAVAYYFRDLGMPLDNMSNTTQLFLGTQMQCAQCHNHPFDKWTQKDFFQMAAFTEGLDRMTAASYNQFNKAFPSKDQISNVLQQSRQMFRHMFYEVENGGAGQINLPDDYQYPDGKPKERVYAKPIFGNSAPIAKTIDADLNSVQNKKGKDKKVQAKPDLGSREAFAKWMIDPENPRFTLVIANRLWKQAMGIGLIEPEDDIREETVPSNPELMEYLTKLMIALRYDMREFQRIVYNTQTFQRSVTREEWDFGEPYHFPGPLLRRLKAEQLWDSLITLTKEDVDQAKPFKESYMLDLYDRRVRTPPEDMATYVMALPENLAISNAGAMAKELQKRKDKASQADLGTDRDALNRQLQLLGKKRKDLIKQKAFDEVKKIDAQTAKLRQRLADQSHFRASELPQPYPNGHFLREFGASDRLLIGGSNDEATITQALSLLNGFVDDYITRNRNSLLMRNIQQAPTKEQKVHDIFASILVREPQPWEMHMLMEEVGEGQKSFDNIIWALLNTHEFMSWN